MAESSTVTKKAIASPSVVWLLNEPLRMVFRSDRDRVVVGRDPTSDLRFGDTTVSRHHAEILRTNGGYEIRDLGSRNGTRVNGDTVQRSTLRTGDVVEVGDVRLACKIEQATDSTSTSGSSTSNDLKNLRLSADLLSRLDPFSFEEMTWLLFERLGWAVEKTPRSNDGGVDGIVARDGKRLALQCKRYKGAVPIAALRELLGAIVHHKLDGGILVTTSRVTKNARTFLIGKSIQVWDSKLFLLAAADAKLTIADVPVSMIVDAGKRRKRRRHQQ